MKRFSVLLLLLMGSLILAGSARSADDSEPVVDLREDESPASPKKQIEECQAYLRGNDRFSAGLVAMLVQTAKGRATLGCGDPDAKESKEPPEER